MGDRPVIHANAQTVSRSRAGKESTLPGAEEGGGQADSRHPGTRPVEVRLQQSKQHLISPTASQKAGCISTCFPLKISWHARSTSAP